MSLIQNIEVCIQACVKEYISTISKKYKLNEGELNSLWAQSLNSSKNPCPTPVEEEPPLRTPLTREAIATADCAKLKAFCKDYSLPSGGKKADLVSRLTDKLNSLSLNSGDEVKVENKVESKAAPKLTQSKLAKSKTPITKPVFKVVESTSIAIRKNKFGHLEHPETKLVFDENKTVVKKQLDNGQLSELTDDDIQLCKKFGFKYTVGNLDSSLVLTKNKEVDDLDIDENAIEDIEEEDEDVDIETEEEDEDIEID